MKRNPNISSKACRRLMSLLALLCLAAILLPLPIAPVAQNNSGKDTSQPFPCQNRPCGCRSAEQCWKKCCCFTNSQKVAWAKANGVDLPNYVLAAAKKETAIAKKPCALCSKKNANDAKQKCEASIAPQAANVSLRRLCLQKILPDPKRQSWCCQFMRPSVRDSRPSRCVFPTQSFQPT